MQDIQKGKKGESFEIITVIPSGMVDILQRLNQQSNRHYGHLPIAILDRFEVTKQNYCSNNFEVDISVSRSEHLWEYYLLY